MPIKRFLILFISILLSVAALWVCRNMFNYGVEYDEVLRLNPLFSMFDPTLEYYDQSLYSVKFLGHTIPVVFKIYVSSAIMLPYFSIALSSDPFTALRLTSFFYFLLAGLTVFWVFHKKSLFWSSMMALGILFSPFLGSHVLVRQAQTYHIICHTLSLLFLYRYFNYKKKPFYLFAASFFIFLALNFEFYSAWSVAALCLALPLLAWHEIKSVFSKKGHIAFIALGLLGAINFVWYNVANGFPVLRLLFKYVFKPEAYNKNPIDGRVIPSVVTDASAKLDELKGYLVYGFSTYVLLILGLILLTVIFYLLSRKHKRNDLYPYFVPFLVTFWIALFICISPKASRSGHFAHLHPYIDLSFFVLPFLFAQLQLKNIVFKVATYSLPLLFVMTNVINSFDLNERFLKTYTKGLWSTAFLDLKSYIEQYPSLSDKLVVMNWGFTEQLYFFSRGQKMPLEYASPMHRLTAEEKRQDYDSFVKSVNDRSFFKGSPVNDLGDLRYLTFTELVGGAIKRTNDVFYKYLEEHGVKYTVEKYFYEKNGEPLFQIIKFENPEALFSSP